jgi:diguanylate cyclase (GGDEF)-like protein
MRQIDKQHQQLKKSEEKLREESVRDILTGLFNRRYLEETLAREVKRADRKKYSLGLIMIDIDHFKKINDTLGHAAGDAFLKEFGQLLKSQVRQYDIACRFGGEEFVLMLPEVPMDLAKERAENLREKTKQLRVKYEEHTLDPITISLGVAVFPEHGATGEAVLKAADEALYKAKREGRDRVVAAG